MQPDEELLYARRAAKNGVPVVQIASCVFSVDSHISHCFCYKNKPLHKTIPFINTHFYPSNISVTNFPLHLAVPID